MTLAPLEADLRRFHAARANHGNPPAFMNAASPGVIALFQPNDFYTRMMMPILRRSRRR